MSKSTFQQKTKLMAKLFDSGCNTEKKLQQLDMESILKIPGITIPDMALIIELQKETKAKAKCVSMSSFKRAYLQRKMQISSKMNMVGVVHILSLSVQVLMKTTTGKA